MLYTLQHSEIIENTYDIQASSRKIMLGDSRHSTAFAGESDKSPAGALSKLPPELRLQIYGYVIHAFPLPRHKRRLM